MRLIYLLVFFIYTAAYGQVQRTIDLTFAHKNKKDFTFNGSEGIALGPTDYRLIVSSAGDAKLYSMSEYASKQSPKVYADFTRLKDWKKTDRILGLGRDCNGNMLVASPDYDGGSLFIVTRPWTHEFNQDFNIHQVVGQTGDLNGLYYDDHNEMVYVSVQVKGEVQGYPLGELYDLALRQRKMIYNEKYKIADIDMPNGITIGHDSALYVTSTGLSSAYLKRIDLKTKAVSDFAKLSASWPDGLIYVPEFKQYVISGNYKGTLETINTKGDALKLITLTGHGEGISPANILYYNGVLHITNLWNPSYIDLATYQAGNYLENVSSKFKSIKENAFQYKQNIYTLMQEDLF